MISAMFILFAKRLACEKCANALHIYSHWSLFDEKRSDSVIKMAIGEIKVGKDQSNSIFGNDEAEERDH
jgi:hypothetical protein